MRWRGLWGRGACAYAGALSNHGKVSNQIFIEFPVPRRAPCGCQHARLPTPGRW
ncbi:hypothetical protein ACRALDRAFT_1063771 [Sodiomyces alcalophilus JCM 7366]|uniref:uncharacterized protein n=1 Tax=Sodiomyces alcalophilus JCM 7366 TaxID=591952 RepID=UPI0039B3752D